MLDHLLSIDPGRHAAYALWERGASAWWLTSVARHPTPSVTGCRDVLAALGVDWQGAAVVIEGQFCSGKRGHSPASDVMLLVELRCRWAHAAELLGAAVEVVAPGIWIPAMAAGAPGEDTKARIRWCCEQRGFGGLVADEHDAVLLGLWWIGRARERAIDGRGDG